MDQATEEFLLKLESTYGPDLRKYLEAYYLNAGVDLTLSARLEHVTKRLGFNFEFNILDGLSEKSLVQAAEICGILYEEFPHLFRPRTDLS